MVDDAFPLANDMKSRGVLPEITPPCSCRWILVRQHIDERDVSRQSLKMLLTGWRSPKGEPR